MNETELKTAIIILQGCIKVRQDRMERMLESGDSFVATIQADIESLELAINHIRDV